MINPVEFRRLVSGQRRGVRASLLRMLLSAAEVPYTGAVRYRNLRFDRGSSPISQVSVPVVSVGNITLGGTGKTPMVAWLARWFRERDLRVTIISRGYRAGADGRNDEALELEQELPDVPHLQNPDRVAAAETAMEELACQVILLDDGFQHRRLQRDLDVVLLDALEPFGFDHVVPRGTLREPVGGLARADVIALSRANMVSESKRSSIRARAKKYGPRAVWIELAHRPTSLVNSRQVTRPAESINGTRVAAFCGIGNPNGFRHTLEESGCQIVAWKEFPDHHPYSRNDIENLTQWAQLSAATDVVCTRKDLVKIGMDRLGVMPLNALQIELQPLAGLEQLEPLLNRLVQLVRQKTLGLMPLNEAKPAH